MIAWSRSASNGMKIYIASDHAGFELKGALIPFLEELEHEVIDIGPSEYNKDDDYPDFIAPVALAISKNQSNAMGVVIGGSGQGEAIVANRFAGVRAAVYYSGNLDIIRLSREHNDANVLSFGSRFISAREAKQALQLWLETSFSGEERHVRRLKKLSNLAS